MAYACVLCLARKSLKGSELQNLAKTEEEFLLHLFDIHNIVARNSGETDEEAIARLRAKANAAATGAKT